jgi:hypothetical protein
MWTCSRVFSSSTVGVRVLRDVEQVVAPQPVPLVQQIVQ